jgi:hypothetical protein
MKHTISVQRVEEIDPTGLVIDEQPLEDLIELVSALYEQVDYLCHAIATAEGLEPFSEPWIEREGAIASESRDVVEARRAADRKAVA